MVVYVDNNSIHNMPVSSLAAWVNDTITDYFYRTDRDATDVGIVALECIVFQLHAGFWVSITESLRELHHTEMAIVLGDLVYMIWSTWYVSPPYYL